MRNVIVFLWFILYINPLPAQLQDKTWICGTYAGKVVFHAGGIDTTSFRPFINGREGWACISTRDGEFQFFTEGVNVYLADGSPMLNGSALADNNVNSAFYYGLPGSQNALILPKKDNQYYIIYQSVSDALFTSQSWTHPDRLYYSVVDMYPNISGGQVTEKRQLINSSNFMDEHMTACQHANGRDWWLVQRGYNNNRYFIYLVTADSISLKHEQFIGAVSKEPDAAGQSAFSPDGSKYASITANSPLIILDFDRCDGFFSNPQKIDIPIDTFTFYGQPKIIGGGGDGICFSPNNRFIYVNSLYILRQYDLLENPIDSSEQVIFLWTDTNERLGQFDQMHLGPDGKIYIASYQGFTEALHEIKYPDSPGLACGFLKWGLPIATNNAISIPNMVHFRTGPLAGSGCDTITDISPQTPEVGFNRQVRVFPNPTSDVVEIDLLSYALYHPQQQFYLYNAQGAVVKQIALPYLSVQVQVSDLPVGVYHWSLAVRQEVRGEGKLEVVR